MAEQPHVMIAVARFYDEIADELVRGATSALKDAGATWEAVEVPGAFEIPAAVATAVRSMEFVGARRRFDGYIALGCVIRGETTHYDYVCGETARGLQDLAVKYCLALGFGVLTVENREQADERAGVDRRDKGGEAARVCLSMIELKRSFGLFPR
ncbi:MAG: 6,7-dimethyl-8-ribityllumazine synthase [Alphaproteobacteria bacterium]|nr:6,7-dimethyl-8-ribityllumazine synthase [Alphaproteobacteria bacterium]